MQMTLKTVFAVAAGGALGAMLRFGLVSVLSGVMGSFPLGTLVVNVVGSFILGGLAELFTVFDADSMTLRAFIVVGCLGAFTTFSTFSLDVITLLGRGEVVRAMIYLGLSVALSILGLYMGMTMVKLFAT